MKASTTSYVTLQNLYKQKAREDVVVFKESLVKLLTRIGLDEGAVEDDEVETFVKNCSTLACLPGRSLRMELEKDVKKAEIGASFKAYTQFLFIPADRIDFTVADLEDIEWDEMQDPSYMGYYIAFLAASHFQAKHGYWPGSKDEVINDGENMGEDAEEVELEWMKDLRTVVEEAKKVFNGVGGEGDLPQVVMDCVGEL